MGKKPNDRWTADNDTTIITSRKADSWKTPKKPMPGSSRFRTRPRAKRRGTKAETRERLILAALELLEKGGEAAVNSVTVTKTAGFVQSAFYQHFGSVKECLAAAADRVTSDLRRAVAGARQRMYDKGPGAGEDLVQYNREVFRLVDQHRHVVRLFLRYRTDPLALDGVMQRFSRDLTADLARQLQQQLEKSGAVAAPAGWIDALAHCLMDANLAAIEAYLADGGLSAPEYSQLLAGLSTGACLGVLDAIGSRQPA